MSCQLTNQSHTALWGLIKVRDSIACSRPASRTSFDSAGISWRRSATLLLCACAVLILTPVLSGQDYLVTKLPTLGGRLTRAFGVNNRGQVVGQSYTSGFDWHAFLSSRSAKIQDLGTFGGSRSVGLRYQRLRASGGTG